MSINEKWCEVVRYDMAHGFFHRDFLSPAGQKIKTRIEIEDRKSACTFAEQDLKDKWKFYRNKYMNLQRRTKK